IALANTTPNNGVPDQITFAASVFGAPAKIMLELGELAITDPVTITGLTGGLTIDGQNASRLFKIDVPTATDQVVSMSNLRLINGNSPSADGGAILNFESLTLTDSVIENCTTAKFGGAVSLATGIATLKCLNVSIRNCSATGSGSYGSAVFVKSDSAVALN